LQVLEDWRYIAMVIDRLQLYIFLAVTVAGTMGILINAPHIYDYVDQDTMIALLKASKNGTLQK
jgi:nicotinic acetylcholine receptor, invertebrate